MKIELIYALPEQQDLLELDVPEGATVEMAIQVSGILEHYPELNLTELKVGVFSEIVNLNKTLQPGDRVEIYRPLLIDPMEARRLRAKS